MPHWDGAFATQPRTIDAGLAIAFGREVSRMKVLSTLTEAGPHGAPERVEIALKQAFRRHHRAHRVRRAMIAAIVTASAAAGIAMAARVPAPLGRPEPIAWYPVPPAIASIKSSPAVQHAPR